MTNFALFNCMKNERDVLKVSLLIIQFKITEILYKTYMVIKYEILLKSIRKKLTIVSQKKYDEGNSSSLYG